MKFKFSFFLALSAILVAGCSAYYSVFGLSQLFAGASTAVIIMASSLEFSKIVAVSFLHRYWQRVGVGLKIYLSIGVFILVCITSAGIYGFLSNAYQKTASKLEISEGEVGIFTNKKSLFEKNIASNDDLVKNKTKRVEQLTSLRNTQESRFDNTNGNSNKNGVRNDINTATQEIQKLNADIDILNGKNSTLLDSVNFYATKEIEVKSKNTTAGEVGPLKYLAQLTGYPMDKIVNWFILLLIFVFDPLAVSLVIATNKVLELEQEANTIPSIWNNLVPDKKKNEEPLLELIEEPVLADLEPIEDIESIEEPIIPEVLIEQNFEAPIDESVITQEPIEEIIIEEPIAEVPITDEPITDKPIAEVPAEKPVIEEPIIEAKIVTPKKEFVVPTGKVELGQIKEIREQTNRGFSKNIPEQSNNLIQRIGSTPKFKRRYGQ